MAGADYESCYVCGTRLFYNPWEKGEPHVMVYTEEPLVCKKCYTKLEKKLVKAEKAKRRGN
jgi:recombinational DNA repair protein (RecF pathway)